MSVIPEAWRRPDPNEEPVTLADEVEAPVTKGEDYKARTPRRDLEGEATEADVLDQAAVVWGEDEDERDLG